MFHPEEEGAHTREVQRAWGRGGTGDWRTLPRQALEVYSVKVMLHPPTPTLRPQPFTLHPHPCTLQQSERMDANDK